ncbi:hypothetical protein E1283_17220 [Streptomyces hainanensis]|uniref:Uncharacterized protein n=1 Tax=Streptomyces hainanensis TaxID=402648 RepID=A0A4R4TFN9_9ACTN|nr:hypothetical protein [Streptomyces hainanensis]TDC74012.1 hypothetical protein E1283_17220 [Streptomyces hainanensis]
MELRLIAGGPCQSGGNGECTEDDCPGIFVTDRGTIAVQGERVERSTPENEAVVEIPERVLREAFRALGW